MLLCSGIGLALAIAFLCAFGHRNQWAHPGASLSGVALLAGASWVIGRPFAAEGPGLPATVLLAAGLATPLVLALPRWNPLGHAALFATVAATGTLLASSASYVLGEAAGPAALLGGLIFLALQLGVVLMLLIGTFEMIETNCRSRDRSESVPPEGASYTPKVSLHVPIHKEPPDLVIATLSALARLEYPDYEVLVVDNNTEDEDLWRPVEAHCSRLGERFRFFHLESWPGYKAGALNFAIGEAHPDAEVIGVVDADYRVEPNYLADLVGHFADPAIGFVQTPQDYRDVASRGRFGRGLYFAYLYFFKISMAWRNDYNAIIFAGTMGLIRRRALIEAGGWSEWCITEDAELSLRILDQGHRSVYVDHSYGRGLMPIDYAGLKKQRFRWAFGGMQLLRMHWRRLLWPGGATHLTPQQRLAYLSGGVQWLSDPLTLCFTLLVLAAWGVFRSVTGTDAPPLASGALALAPLLIVTSILRFTWAIRARTDCSRREALDGLTVLLGLSWTTSIACLEGLMRRRGVFLRTPKEGARIAFLASARVVAGELMLATICLAAMASLIAEVGPDGGWAPFAFSLLLLWNGVVYLSAAQTSLWSYLERAALLGQPDPMAGPDELGDGSSDPVGASASRPRSR